MTKLAVTNSDPRTRLAELEAARAANQAELAMKPPKWRASQLQRAINRQDSEMIALNTQIKKAEETPTQHPTRKKLSEAQETLRGHDAELERLSARRKELAAQIERAEQRVKFLSKSGAVSELKVVEQKEIDGLLVEIARNQQLVRMGDQEVEKKQTERNTYAASLLELEKAVQKLDDQDRLKVLSKAQSEASERVEELTKQLVQARAVEEHCRFAYENENDNIRLRDSDTRREAMFDRLNAQRKRA